LKFFIKDTGWVVFRPSGTEPKIKFYISVKANNEEESIKTTEAIYENIMQIINKLCLNN